MPILVGQNPANFPNLANNEYCRQWGEVPEDLLRLRCDPFIRLFSIPTKNFLIKRCTNPNSAQDSLDRALSACYDHHRQFWVPKPGVVMQCETYRLFPFGRAQARLCRLQCLPDHPMTQPCPFQPHHCVNNEPYRNDCNHIDCNIGNSHVTKSAVGFARGPSGSFFNSV